MRRTDLVFFLTGAAALVYESAWARLLARILGSGPGATAVVLSVFMGGMGIGALALAPAARRTGRPRLLFAALEWFVAGWAAASPFLLGLLHPVDGFANRALVAGLLLLPPTLAMGATFPLMGRLTVARPEETGAETAGFYGANTLGACAGALLGAFLLLPLLGFRRGLAAAAGLDRLAGGLALTLGRVPRPGPGPAPRPRGPREGDLLLVPFFFGLSALALEVLLTRLLVTVTGASVYAFAIVLAVFLAGIGIGGRGARRLLARERVRGRLLAGCGLAVPVFTLLGLLLLRSLLGESDLFGDVANRLPRGIGPLALWTSHAVFAAVALFPGALAFGAALPAAVDLFARGASGAVPERVLGRVYAANTGGALLGSLLGGFFLLPVVEPRYGVAAALLPGLAAAALLFARLPGLRGWWWWLGTGAAALLGVAALRPGPPAEGMRVLRLEVGPHATAVVEERVPGGGRAVVRSLRINGKVVATTAPVDLRLQRLIAVIPGHLHGRVRSALVIGLGTGMTAGALLDFPSVRSLEVCEISPAVVRAAEAFSEWNGGLLEDPRVDLRVVDGRHALARSRRRFDLITADPIHPWTRGSSDLYSREHFLTMAARLAPGGVASQWLPLYQLSEEDVKTIVATWLSAFPRTSAWLTAYDLVLVGSREAVGEGAERRALPPRVRRSLSEAGIRSPAELLALRVGGTEDLRALAGSTPPMGDDRPVLEFRAPLSYLAGYCVPVLRWAARPGSLAALPAASREPGRRVRRLLVEFLARLPRGADRAIAAYGRALLAGGTR